MFKDLTYTAYLFFTMLEKSVVTSRKRSANSSLYKYSTTISTANEERLGNI